MDVDPELVERFRADLAPLWPFVGEGQQKLGIALSGGGDSLALLLLANAALPGRVEAATVDHQLRAESAGEAQLAASFCAALGVPHRILQVEVGEGNVQDRAREARYNSLGEWCVDRDLDGLATAHQMEDQAETFLMRLNRGSGLSGLSSIRALGSVPNALIRLVRPLLGWRRAELVELVRSVGWEPVADPSNENTDFDRVRMRRQLAECDWLDIAAIGRSASFIAEANDTLEWVIGREYNQRVTYDGTEAIYRALETGVGGTLVRGGVIRAIFRLLGVSVDQRVGAALVENLIGGLKTNVAGIQTEVRDVDGERLWVFRKENPRRTG
ncbi:MAG: tRNA lysidine(34) synthetase TilS [Qipengyuania vulgaris]